MTDKKPQARVFIKKKRGDKKFVADHHNLIRNVAQDAGLLEYDHGRMGYVMPKVVTSEMIQLAKDAKSRASVKVSSPTSYSILRGEFKGAKRASDWTLFWAALDLYDRANKGTVTVAMRAWLVANPAVRSLNNTKRMAALRDAASKMIAFLDNKAGRDTCANLIASLTTEKHNSCIIPVFVKEV